MMVQAKFSNSFKAKQQRIKRLPKIMDDIISGVSKKDSVGIIDEYKNGIRTQSLGLERLKPDTIKQKERKGRSRPSIPLYSWGDDEKNSLINCLRIQKLKNGWKILARNAYHHRKDNKNPITLKFLHKIHEFGAIISKRRNKKGKPIRILPRPALTRAYRFYMSKLRKNKKETSRVVKSAINDYIQKSNIAEINNLIAYNKRYKELEKD